MESPCEPNKYLVDTGINVILHVAILFFILSMFFMFYVSKIIRQSFEHELEHLIKKNINESLNSLSHEEQLVLKQASKSVDLSKLIKYYSKEDKTIKSHNDWLFKTIITINVFLLILTIVVLVTSNTLCSKADIQHMMIENLIIFAGVGAVEFMFFKFIALNYIPAPPSLMVTSIIDGLKNSLSE